MSENKTVVSGGGIGFAGTLTIVFIVLKLVGVIDWAWVWVVSPIWISFAGFLGLLIIVSIVLGIVALIQALLDR